MDARTRYESYVKFSESVGARPMDFETWCRFSDTIPDGVAHMASEGMKGHKDSTPSGNVIKGRMMRLSNRLKASR